jgi:hypothetical protein
MAAVFPKNEESISSLPEGYLLKSPNNKPDRLNQAKLRTDIESLNPGDPHPKFPFLILMTRASTKRGESWGTVEQFKRKSRTDKPKPKPKTITKTCAQCGKDFNVEIVHGGLKFKKFCSDKCNKSAAAHRARKRREGTFKKTCDPHARSKEQTGKPKGTYRFGDPHPTDPNYVYWGWRENIPKYKNSPEKWVPREAYEKELVRRKERKEKRRKESEYVKRVEKVKSLQLHTDPDSKDRLTYGTIHPFEPNWIFFGYKRGKESWLPKDEFETGHASSVEYHRRKRTNDPEYTAKQKDYDRIRHSNFPGYNATRNVLERCPELTEQINSLTDKQHRVINQIYLHAARVTKRFGIKFAVDHTTPISLGGLHEPSNLQVVPANWNTRKHNHHTEPWPFPFDQNAKDPNSGIEFNYKRVEFYKIMQAKSVVSKLKAKRN